MKTIKFLILSASLMASSALCATDPVQNACACGANCPCTPKKHCGCHSDKGCSCAEGTSCQDAANKS